MSNYTTTYEYELNEREKSIIETHRKHMQKERQRSLRILELLKVAYEYEKWLQDNGAGSSFSTFCDDFGFEGKDRKYTFGYVEKIRMWAKELA